MRLPLVIGLGHLLARAHAMLRAGRLPLPDWLRQALPAVVVTSLLVVACAPAVGVALARPEGYRAIPDHWRQAAAWLDAQPAPGAVLVAPAASFSDLTWAPPRTSRSRRSRPAPSSFATPCHWVSRGDAPARLAAGPPRIWPARRGPP